jgi:aminobenzoyl-glutamate utilization protein B
MNTEAFIENFIDAHASEFKDMCSRIWEFSEIRFREFKSSALQQEYLKKNGFSIRAGLAGEKTAFIAEYGTGSPVIGFLGEFDALPDLGHGCGHHLLGTGDLAAAVALRYCLESLQSENISGTVRYYGCPAEENAGGKGFLVRDGFFDDCDIALSWHPGTENRVVGNGSLANFRVFYNFHGKSAHAAAAPQMGRSALDAVELMDVGTNYLREHVPDGVRIHYAITNAGGTSPNVVQSESQVLYAIRAKDIDTVKQVFARVSDIARGAGLMTGTTVDIKQVAAYSDYINTDFLSSMVYRELKVFDSDSKYDSESPSSGSTDVGDVSWVVPTAYFSTVCYEAGTALHSEEAVKHGRDPLAYNGMLTAAKVLARTALHIYLEPQSVGEAVESWKKRLGQRKYISPLPSDVLPDSW